MHPVQPVRIRVPACHHSSLRPDRGRGGSGSPKTTLIPAKGQGRRWSAVHACHLSARLHGLQRLRGSVPHEFVVHSSPQRTNLPSREVFDYCVAEVSDKPEIQGCHGQGQPVQAAPARVLRRMCRLRSDCVCPSGHPAVRRSHVHFQRNGLLFDLGRSCCHVSVHGEQRGPRSRMGQLLVRGQRRARPWHAARAECRTREACRRDRAAS